MWSNMWGIQLFFLYPIDATVKPELHISGMVTVGMIHPPLCHTTSSLINLIASSMPKNNDEAV